MNARVRIVARYVLTGLAAALLWFALLVPNRLDLLTPVDFVRIPIEGLVLVALMAVLPARARRPVAVVAGVLIAVVTILKFLDMGFFNALDRPFDPLSDWAYFGSAEGFLGDSIGRDSAIVIVVAAVVVCVGLLVLLPFALLRVTRLADRHRRTSGRVLAVLGFVWALGAVLGVHVAPGAPLASANTAGQAYDQISRIRTDLLDQRKFEQQKGNDALSATPTTDLLAGLRGKDVLVVFVESYGRVAVQGSDFSPQVDAHLAAGMSRLRSAGFGAKSAFLTSPTFGGISWLAHSTLQTGLWVDNQLRYNNVVASDRFTLSDAFRRAGWRTVADIPSNYLNWRVGTSFYHYEKIYDRRNVGYAGPKFSYAAMPDQYTLAEFQRLELAKPGRGPVMAEIDLVSSHTPWTPLPHLVSWNKLGNGSVFDGMPAQGRSPADVWRHAADVRQLYGQSIAYSMDSLTSFVQQSHDKNLVLVVLGDHQPATIVSGQDADHDVPISIIAHDPAVLQRISGWGWQDGLRPSPTAPVWLMSDFRDRFLRAYDGPP